MLEARAHRREKPTDRAVHMLKLERRQASTLDRVQPLRALQVTAGPAQPLQRECEARSLDVEPEAAAVAQRAEDLGKSLRLPQALEHQGGAPRARPVRLDALASHPLHHAQLLAEPAERLQQRIEHAVGDELIATPEGRDHALANATRRPHRLDDLQVLVLPLAGATTFHAHEHARRMIVRRSIHNIEPPAAARLLALHFVRRSRVIHVFTNDSARTGSAVGSQLSKMSLSDPPLGSRSRRQPQIPGAWPEDCGGSSRRDVLRTVFRENFPQIDR